MERWKKEITGNKEKGRRELRGDVLVALRGRQKRPKGAGTGPGRTIAWPLGGGHFLVLEFNFPVTQTKSLAVVLFFEFTFDLLGVAYFSRLDDLEGFFLLGHRGESFLCFRVQLSGHPPGTYWSLLFGP